MKFQDCNPKNTIYAGMLCRYVEDNLGGSHFILGVKLFEEDGAIYLICEIPPWSKANAPHLVDDLTIQLGTIFKWYTCGNKCVVLECEGIDALGVDALVNKLFSMRPPTEYLLTDIW